MTDATTDSTNPLREFRRRLLRREPLIGTWQKTPSAIVSEVLGLSTLDAVCLDAEHAPFGRRELDACIFALRAAAMPSLVRVASDSPAEILNALDCGATGVVVPHVRTAAQAERVAGAAHFPGRKPGREPGRKPGRERGYAGSTRAAGYTTKAMKRHLAESAEGTVVIAQIEDIEAVEAIGEIAAVEGIDCLFIGRMDLTVSLGAESPDDPEVVEAVNRVCIAGRDAGKPVGMFVPDADEVARWRKEGASLFLLGSDHTFMLQGAANLVDNAGIRGEDS